MEEIDHQHCSHPETSILAGGGQILLAMQDGEIVGAAGLLKDDDQTYELIKMAVDDRYRGSGIGKLLCEAAIERAKQLHAKLLYLFSNTGGSDAAIRLYRKLGFEEAPIDRNDFARADIRMEMYFLEPEELERLKYPIGRHHKPGAITPAMRNAWLDDLDTLPDRLEAALSGLSDKQLDTNYRPGGWTLRQLVHHIADSHINAHCRLRWALTEASPIIKPYEEKEWSKLPDATLPVAASLSIIRGIHYRWVHLLKSLNNNGLERFYVHPADQKTYTLTDQLALYAWHSNHHLAHITRLRERRGW
jgi:GNAT superfamily N-acetyltransferase